MIRADRVALPVAKQFGPWWVFKTRYARAKEENWHKQRMMKLLSLKKSRNCIKTNVAHGVLRFRHGRAEERTGMLISP